MKVYRGPYTEHVGHGSYEQVDEVDLGQCQGLTHQVSFNLSKDAPERRSSGSVVLSADEVAKLHASMIPHLLARAAMADYLESGIREIWRNLTRLEYQALDSRPLLHAIKLRLEVLTDTPKCKPFSVQQFQEYLAENQIKWEGFSADER